MKNHLICHNFAIDWLIWALYGSEVLKNHGERNISRQNIVRSPPKFARWILLTLRNESFQVCTNHVKVIRCVMLRLRCWSYWSCLVSLCKSCSGCGGSVKVALRIMLWLRYRSCKVRVSPVMVVRWVISGLCGGSYFKILRTSW